MPSRASEETASRCAAVAFSLKHSRVRELHAIMQWTLPSSDVHRDHLLTDPARFAFRFRNAGLSAPGNSVQRELRLAFRLMRLSVTWGVDELIRARSRLA